MEELHGPIRPFLLIVVSYSAAWWRKISNSSVRYGQNTDAIRGGPTAMDFALTDRQAHFRNKVRDFMEEHVRPSAGEYLAQASSRPRWKVLPVVEDLKAKA